MEVLADDCKITLQEITKVFSGELVLRAGDEFSYNGGWKNGKRHGNGIIRNNKLEIEIKFFEGVPIKIRKIHKKIDASKTLEPYQNSEIIILGLSKPKCNKIPNQSDMDFQQFYYFIRAKNKIAFNGKVFKLTSELQWSFSDNYILVSDANIKFIEDFDTYNQSQSFTCISCGEYSYMGQTIDFIPNGKGSIIINGNYKISGNFRHGMFNGLQRIKKKNKFDLEAYFDGMDLPSEIKLRNKQNFFFNQNHYHSIEERIFNINLYELNNIMIQEFRSIKYYLEQGIDSIVYLKSIIKNISVNKLSIGPLKNKPVVVTRKVTRVQLKCGIYVGEIINSKLNGKGKLFFNNKDVYFGQFEDNKIQGFGTYYYKDGTIYTGEFVNGKRHGIGNLIDPNKNKYQGQWSDNKMHGKGIYTTSYFTIEGNWFENSLWFSKYFESNESCLLSSIS